MKNDLNKKIKETNKEIERLKQEKKNLEESVKVVQKYIEVNSELEEQIMLQEILNNLERGEDGTIFEKYTEPLTKTFSSHFGLSVILDYAFDLMQKETDIYNGRYEITFLNLLIYIENAKKILNDMNYYEGDIIVNNLLGYDVYKNPKTYSVVNFSELLPLDNQKLHSSYNVDNISIKLLVNKSNEVAKYVFVTDNPKTLPSNNTKSRIEEAFYGEQAKKALGITKKKAKTKTKTN